ncbi:SPT16 protein, partial [Geococcyx californianus]|nr:SPT16 protein [Geococcyx californianus]
LYHQKATSTSKIYILSMDGKNKTSQQMHDSKESNAAESKLRGFPEALQDIKKHLKHGAAENTMKRINVAEKKKEKQSNDRANRKRKLENNEKLTVIKEETMTEISNQIFPEPPNHVPLKNIMDIEKELVYIDEEDIFFEFPEELVSASRSGSYDSDKADDLSASNDKAVSQIDKQLQTILQDASICYRQNNYTAAVEKLSKALKCCSNGAAMDNYLDSFPEDISSIVSFIETKLVTCYLKLRKPDDALNHSHRSIILNPAYFRNHLRQATVFRYLGRYSEAARSAMIADFIYWLTEDTEQHTSKLIRMYWQAMFEEAIVRELSFSVMYTPIATEVTADQIDKIEDIFARNHPDYVEYIYTDPRGLHILPQTTEWLSLSPQRYLLTLGFKSKHIGKTLERWSYRRMPVFSDWKAPFCPLTEEETKAYWTNTGKKIVPVMDFIRSTKLSDNLCPCSRGIEKFHYASLLGRLQRVEEQSQVINQAMAELATVPYLQDVSKQDAKMLQLLMADAMDTLEGRNHKGRVWNKIQKIGLIEDYLYQAEDNYLRNKRHRVAKRERMKMNRIQSTQQQYNLRNKGLSFTSPKDMTTQ